LTKFPQNIFDRLLNLNQNIEINLNGSKFKCDCDIIWLFEDRIKNKISGIVDCLNFNKTNLFELNEHRICVKPTQMMNFGYISHETCTQEIISDPCICNEVYPKLPQIVCEGPFITNIQIKVSYNKKFSSLHIYETNVTVLKDNDISRAHFDRVWIHNNPNLMKISKNIFYTHPKYLIIEKNQKLTEDNFFPLARMLSNTMHIKFKYSSIRTVPVMAFSETVNNSLETIFLNHNKIIITNPNSFANLLKLRYLDLSHNLLRYLLEDSFSGNLMLEEINLESNRLVFIESKAFNNLPNLFYLSFDDNKLMSIPENMFVGINNRSLRIHLNNNNINFFDTIQYFNRLDFLNLSNNSLTALSENCFKENKHLEGIDLSNNKISTLSTTFNNLVKLHVLQLSYNRITEVANNNFNGSNQIEVIDLSENKISKIGENVFYELEKLQNLNLGNNLIEEIPKQTFSRNVELMIIVLKDNKIKKIDSNTFYYLPKLQKLDLSYI
jgi:Leucine-rich repeat (LRR) protein